MEFCPYTEKAFRELKNFSANTLLKNRARGTYVEDLSLDFFKKQKLSVRARNKKIWGVEHDFIVSNVRGELLFVEVKSLARLEDLAWRLKRRQRLRLLRSAEAYVQTYAAKSLGVWLLAIERDGTAHFHQVTGEL